MARKIGDLVLGVIFLVFVITGFSAFMLESDYRLNVSSGIVSSNLYTLESNLSSFKVLEGDFSQKLDNTSSLLINPADQVDTRGDESVGILNLLSKNILIKFFKSVANTFDAAIPVLIFLTSLLVVYISILLLRFWRGDGAV